MNTAEPTDEQINRGIAEWMGCYVEGPDEQGYYHGYAPDGSRIGQYCKTETILLSQHFPSFTTSHGDCHEVLERMTDEQVEEYMEQMLHLIGSDVSASDADFRKEMKAFVCATARQKALAIYHTINNP